MSPLRLALRWCWRWSLLLTAPVALLFTWWLLGIAHQVGEFRLRHDLAPYDFGFASEGTDHARQLLRSLAVAWTPGGIVDGLPLVQLRVRGDQLASLDTELPQSGFTPVPGELLTETGWADVSVRYRGDFWYHWAYAKKSLRVRVQQRGTAFGTTTFHLIAPKLPAQCNDVAAYHLAAELGVLTPRAELVQLRINGEERGLYQFVEHPTDALLRLRGCRDAVLWAGELVARDAWAGVDNYVFDHPGTWAAMADDPATARDPRPVLQRLCALLAAPPDDASMRALDELLDLDAFGRFFAAETLAQSLHNDDAHNWRLWFDPVRQRVEPMLWDPNGWGALHDADVPISLDPVPSRLHAVLLAHPRVQRARAEALAAFLHDGRSEAFLRWLRQLAADAERCVPRDPGLRPPDPQAVLAAMQALPAAVERTFHSVAAAQAQQPPVLREQRDGALWLAVDGRAPVVALQLEFAAPQPLLQLCLRTRQGEATVDRPLAVARRDSDRVLLCAVTLPAASLPAPTTGPGGEPVSTRAIAAATYALVTADGTPLPLLRAVRTTRAAAATAVPTIEGHIAPRALDSGPGLAAEQPAPPTAWQGRIDLDGTRELAGDLLLAPGPELRFAAGASLVVRGHLHAVGTAAQPIRFVAADPARAFGAIALLGDDRDADRGAHFAHCVFTGGSERAATDGRGELPAMLTLRSAGEVSFEHCTFDARRGGAAAVLVGCTDAEFAHCRWVGGPGHALAVERGRVALRDCRIADATGDAVQLVRAEAVLTRCEFEHCARGIAATAQSRALLTECRVDDCGIGALAVEASDVVLANCTLGGGERTLQARLGDHRFGRGGTLQALRCQLNAATAAPLADDASRLRLADCWLQELPRAHRNLELLGCDDREQSTARLAPEPLQLAFAQHQRLAERLWTTTATHQRGAP